MTNKDETNLPSYGWGAAHEEIWKKLMSLKLVSESDCLNLMLFADFYREFRMENEREPTIKEVIEGMELK